MAHTRQRQKIEREIKKISINVFIPGGKLYDGGKVHNPSSGFKSGDQADRDVGLPRKITYKCCLQCD